MIFLETGSCVALVWCTVCRQGVLPPASASRVQSRIANVLLIYIVMLSIGNRCKKDIVAALRNLLW